MIVFGAFCSSHLFFVSKCFVRHTRDRNPRWWRAFPEEAPTPSKSVAGSASRSQVQEENAAIAGSLAAPTTNCWTNTVAIEPEGRDQRFCADWSPRRYLPMRDIDEPTVGI